MTKTWGEKLGDIFGRVVSGVLDVGSLIITGVDQGYQQIDGLRSACMRSGWCFTPDFPFHVLLESALEVNAAKNQHQALYRRIRAFLAQDDWRELKAILQEASLSPALGSKRRKILEDCIQILPMHGRERFNAAHLIVPTLLSVIDGIIADFAIGHLGINNWHSKRLTVKRQLEGVCFTFDLPAIELLFEVLFSTARATTVPASGRRFNRHHIVHGNWLDYGRIEYVLRLFLLTFFVSYIVDEYVARNASGDTEPVTDRSQYSKLLSENPVASLREMAIERLSSRNVLVPSSNLYLAAVQPQPTATDGDRQ